MDFEEDIELGDVDASKAPGDAARGSSLRDASPLPAPVPTKPAYIPRESLDGETIFAVGEEDKLTDDEDDDDLEENQRLTHKTD